ncbi:tyrosine-type recombinase/integrase [Nocardia uniformis]|uniref:Tyrosine-type recombinase/integrase n=1 Tax=Nocardia uniformis TaxID=53432 RepID=A0A849BR69_9NOCA|nr:tyrosine-type recombinase/integrase [Nocardia uniformis]NNH69182.1 tyrosine-type recombinase/integrase [Nocardia uniformis]
MPRPPIPEGKRGEAHASIDKERQATGKKDYWRGICRYRLTGERKPRTAQAYRTSEAKAKRDAAEAADKALKTRKPEYGQKYSSKTTVLELCLSWYERECNTPDGNRGQSIAAFYTEIVKRPGGKKGTVKIEGSELGKMAIGEVRTSHVERHLDPIRHMSEKAYRQRLILVEAFALAARDDAITGNPARESETIERGHKDEPRPFTPEETQRFWEIEAKYFELSPTADKRFMDITRLTYDLLGRPGEALAVIWEDVDLEAGTVAVTGTVVQVGADGKRKVWRQPMPKEDESVRTVKVSAESLAMLKRRWLAVGKPTTGLVFPNKLGNPISATMFRETWVRVLKGTELDWATPKALRKTGMTRISEKYGDKAAQQQGGHAIGSRVTRKHYVPTVRETADFTDALYA